MDLSKQKCKYEYILMRIEMELKMVKYEITKIDAKKNACKEQ